MSLDVRPRPTSRRRAESTPAAPVPTDNQSATPAPPRLPGRRNPKWIALGIVALCLGGLLSYFIYSQVATEAAVVATTRTVYRGEVIEAEDLTRVVVRGSSSRDAVPAADLDAVAGRRAALDLPANSPVLRASVSDVALPGPGRSVVGLKLSTGKAPDTLLVPSSPVRLVALPPSSTDAGTDDKLAGKSYTARIIDQAPGPDGTSIVVNVEVDATQAPTIAQLAAQERIAVVRDPEG